MIAYPRALADAHACLRLARRWLHSRVISPEQLDSIRAAISPDYRPMHSVLAVVIFLLTVVAIGALYTFVLVLIEPDGFGTARAFAGIAALACFALAEHAARSTRLAHSGVDWGLQLALAVFLFIVVLPVDGDPPLLLAAVLSVLAVAPAALRYGTVLLALLLYACLAWVVYVLVTDTLSVAQDLQLPAMQGWFLLCLIATLWASRLQGVSRWHGHAVWIELVSLSAVYGLGNYFVAKLAGEELTGGTAPVPLEGYYLLVTGLLPPVYTALGVALRRPLLIRIGIVTLVLSAFTYQHHFFRDSLREFLLLAGIALLAATVLLHRRIEGGRGRFLSRPLLTGELDELNLDSLLMGKSAEVVARQR